MWLAEAEWASRRRRHEERVDALLGDHLARRSRGQKHPVDDPAFRFFTPAARPLNVLTPTWDSQIELDQPGCLHANMGLYDDKGGV